MSDTPVTASSLESILAGALNNGNATANSGSKPSFPKVRIEEMRVVDGEIKPLFIDSVQINSYTSWAVKTAYAALPSAEGMDDAAKKDAVSFLPGSTVVFVRHQFKSEVDTSDVVVGSMAALAAQLTGGA